MVDYFKNLFNRLVKFIKNKMFGKDKEQEDYWKFSKDLYEHEIFSNDTIKEIHEEYIYGKNHNKKSKDDFDISI